MALMSKPTDDPKVSRWWWRALRTWVYGLVDPLWAAFRGENSEDIALTNVTSINGVSSTELTVLNGLTATTAELNLLAGLTATAAELNKSDRTVAAGVAEASKNVVLDANKDILGKRYDINQSLLSLIASAPHLHLDGDGDSVLLGDDGNFQFGSGDFSFVIVFRANSKAEAQVLFSKRASGGIEAYLKTDGALLFYVSDGTDTYSVTTTDTGFDDGEVHVVVGVADRDTELAVHIDGYQRAVTPTGTLANVDSVSEARTNLRLGAKPSGTDFEFVGDLFQALFFNRALTADEVKALTSGAPLAFADVGASQSDRVTNGDDWTGATGSTPPNSWSDSGGASATYIIRDNTSVANMDDKVLEIDISGTGSKTLSQGVFQIGKRYRVTFAYRNLDGSGGATKVTFGSSTNSATLQNTTISGDGIIFQQDVLADGTDLAFEVTTDGALQVDGVQVVQVGCVAEYRPDGITAAQWQDATGNELHGQVNGAIPLNLPSNHLAAYVKKGITADSTLTGVVPAGYRLRSIIVEETAGNAITGGLKIGTGAGGIEVVNAQAVGANALVDCALGTRLFSLTTAQTLYVEDVTAWNSASIDLYLEMDRIK